MHPPRQDFQDFYEAQVGARRQLHSATTLTDRFREPSIVLTVVLLLAAALYNFWGSPSLETAVIWLESSLWDLLVTLSPAALIQALDRRRSTSRMNPASLDTHAAKSAAMRRILGLSSTGGVVSSALQSRTRALSVSSMLGFKADPERPPGLGNRDNSCFQNSILQGLASLQTFPDYLAACERAAEADDADSEVAQTLRALINDLTDGVHNGRTIWTPNKLRFMSTWTQQDAQEYYSKILDDIDKGIAKSASNNMRRPGFESDRTANETFESEHSDGNNYQSLSASSKSHDISASRNPLEGLLAQRVACVECGYSEGLSMIPFNCLTLSLGLDRGQHDLYERLDAYSKVEPIEGVECSKCTLLKAQRLLKKLIEQMRGGGSSEAQLAEPLRRLAAVEEALEDDDFEDKTIVEKCKIPSQSRVSSTKTKQVVIARPPRSLAVHMNRSVFDPSTFDMMKNSAPVNFPLTLDLGPWCLGSKIPDDTSAQPDVAATEGAGNTESWALDPRASMVAGDTEPSRLSGPIYELRAAVTHAGRHENGHYICYRRHARQKTPTQTAEEAEAVQKMDQTVENDDVQSQSDIETDQRSSEGVGAVGDSETAEMSWWRLSDHNVSRVEEDTVLSLSPGVFMLFYDCVDPSMVVNDDADIMQDAQAEINASSTLEDDLPVATPELTGDDDDGVQTPSEGPGTPRNAADGDESRARTQVDNMKSLTRDAISTQRTKNDVDNALPSEHA
ncbi:ubiquitin carboxyl-terminal hydrolase domain-containing protein [Sarocladium implicatum]|nr:ubiquitin carboxyl-terminal hydrolase domain-containing protein [Sarocladium implicatum]